MRGVCLSHVTPPSITNHHHHHPEEIAEKQFRINLGVGTAGEKQVSRLGGDTGGGTLGGHGW